MEPIRLDPTAGGVDFEPDEWRACPREFGLMHHLPTGTDYFVTTSDELRRTGEGTIFDFEACAVGDNSGPATEDTVKLGRAAIAVLLIETGIWNPEIVEVPASPKPRQRGPKHRRLNR